MLFDDRRAMLRKLKVQHRRCFCRKNLRVPEEAWWTIFGKIVFGDWELMCSAIWRNRARRFGGIVLDDLEESFSAIWRNRSRRFGGIVLGDLEEPFLAIWRN